MGFNRPGSIIESSIRRDHDDAFKWVNPPADQRAVLDRIIASGAMTVVPFMGHHCAVVRATVENEKVTNPDGRDAVRATATYWLRPVVFQQGEDRCQDQTR